MPVNERNDKAPHINETAQPETGLEVSQPPEFGGIQTSSAPSTSFETGSGQGAMGFDSPPIGSQWLGNTEVAGVEHAGPYFPPGGAPDVDASDADQRGPSNSPTDT